MQPYFFPYLGYFQLLSAADRWVVFDETQFVHKGWVNRNRVLHPDPGKEWRYLTVPLHKLHREDRICDVVVKGESDWTADFFAKLTTYRKQAPFYDETIDFLRSCIVPDTESLSLTLISTLTATAEYLGIDTPLVVQSELALELGDVQHAGQWALRISQALGASTYLNPIGGRDIFRPQEFQNAGIGLEFLRPALPAYDQKREPFTPGLSIIDVLMWNGPEGGRKMLSSGVEIVSAVELDRESAH
ncbi:MAG: WbqC family protein [Pseudomonadota bacterium]